MKKIFGIIGIVAGLTACQTIDHYNPIATGQTFLCDHARQIVIAMSDNPQRAAIIHDGMSKTLNRVYSYDNDLAFTSPPLTLYYKDDVAVLERAGVPILTGCVQEKTRK